MYTTNHFDEIDEIDEIDRITLPYITKANTFSLSLVGPHNMSNGSRMNSGVKVLFSKLFRL